MSTTGGTLTITASDLPTSKSLAPDHTAVSGERTDATVLQQDDTRMDDMAMF